MMISYIIIFVVGFIPLFALEPFDQSRCGHSKSCVRWSSCELNKCDFGYSWKMITYNSSKYLELEIVGKMSNSTFGYIALGFSTDNKMNDDGVVACRIQNSIPFISSGVNGFHYNTLFADTDVDSNFLIKSKDSLYGVEFDSSDNELRCRFLRLMTPNLKKAELKDLDNGNKYYILSAKGVRNSPKALSYHGQNRRISPDQYDLSSTNRINNIININYTFIKLHGSLMILGWILFATNGIILAYFYKKNWSEKTFIGKKLWFQFHRLLQTSCVLCVIAGFVIIFVNVGGYSTLGSLPNSAHPVLGIIATSLMFINPIIALFRCKPDSKLRWIFNTIHLVVGVTAYICALCTMAIGIQLPPAGPYLPNMVSPWICVVTFLTLTIVLFIFGVLRKLKIENRVDISSKDPGVSSAVIVEASYDILIVSITNSVIFFTVLIILVWLY